MRFVVSRHAQLSAPWVNVARNTHHTRHRHTHTRQTHGKPSARLAGFVCAIEAAPCVCVYGWPVGGAKYSSSVLGGCLVRSALAVMCSGSQPTHATHTPACTDGQSRTNRRAPRQYPSLSAFALWDYSVQMIPLYKWRTHALHTSHRCAQRLHDTLCVCACVRACVHGRACVLAGLPACRACARDMRNPGNIYCVECRRRRRRTRVYYSVYCVSTMLSCNMSLWSAHEREQ